MAEPTDITFEAGYKRLEEIAERVNSESVSVDEMCDLFAEGKGLDKALTAYLEEQKGRIERIERGEEIQAFRIRPTAEETPANEEAEPPPAGPTLPLASDDEIPF
jgi:exodeoxyribonuclease VII small subunit